MLSYYFNYLTKHLRRYQGTITFYKGSTYAGINSFSN